METIEVAIDRLALDKADPARVINDRRNMTPGVRGAIPVSSPAAE